MTYAEEEEHALRLARNVVANPEHYVPTKRELLVVVRWALKMDADKLKEYTNLRATRASLTDKHWSNDYTGTTYAVYSLEKAP